MSKGKYPPGFIDRVASATDIAVVIGKYTTLKNQGRRLLGLCPFHSEKTPSFSVDSEQGLFYCFGCHIGGNVFTFLMEKEGMTFSDAVESLAHDAGLELPAQSAEFENTEGINHAAEYSAEFFAKALESELGAEAREYLQGRGISEKTWRAFNIGWAPADRTLLPKYIRRKKCDFNPFVKIGVLWKPRYEQGFSAAISDALVFPIAKTSGKPVGFAHRRIREDGSSGPKYVNSADNDIYHKSTILYGLPQARAEIREKGRSILVEGYFDVIALHEKGIANAVACCGTALTSVQATILARYAPRVVILFDGDDAGLKATLRSIDILLSAGLEVNVVRLPEREDPDDFVKNRGAEALRGLIESAPGWFDWLYQRALANCASEGVDSTIALVVAMTPPLSAVKDELSRNMFLRELALRLGTTEEELRGHIKRENARNRARDRSDEAPIQRPELSPLAKLELALLSAVVRTGAVLPVGDNPLELYAGLWESAVSGTTPNDFLSIVSDSRARSKLAEIFLEPEPEDCAGHIARLMSKILKMRIDHRMKSLNDGLRQAESKGDIEAQTRIFEQISDLSQKMRELTCNQQPIHIQE